MKLETIKIRKDKANREWKEYVDILKTSKEKRGFRCYWT